MAGDRLRLFRTLYVSWFTSFGTHGHRHGASRKHMSHWYRQFAKAEAKAQWWSTLVDSSTRSSTKCLFRAWWHESPASHGPWSSLSNLKHSCGWISNCGGTYFFHYRLLHFWRLCTRVGRFSNFGHMDRLNYGIRWIFVQCSMNCGHELSWRFLWRWKGFHSIYIVTFSLRIGVFLNQYDLFCCVMTDDGERSCPLPNTILNDLLAP